MQVAVNNYSKYGLALKTNNQPNLTEGERLILKASDTSHSMANYIIENLLKRNAFDFTVLSIDSVNNGHESTAKNHTIRLQATSCCC